ncbi:TrmH family RNA methyltransferase [Christiangramia sabulilitoris]|uniref:TrmH family RNA methyltransferase n=1 Tax=Christiangramia sabulilitoris TaxID=2583991 RepID=A0A550I626_9FLAO|nr:TrmH family RNA methyltransferase [Christiangramia sabulilitoris]TRO66429.1 TrmH family RNA methyltransferase [Christiangramia sabulilitoris]
MIDQLTHEKTSFQKTEFPIILLLDNITSEANLGSIFRLADAFGVHKVIFCGTRPNLKSNRLKRTARNTYNTVNFEFQEDAVSSINILKTEGYRALALEITSNSKNLHTFELNQLDQILLIAGNERHGISEEVLKLCEEFYHIQMFGENSSMNVAQSVGIALYEITTGFNKFHKK